MNRTEAGRLLTQPFQDALAKRNAMHRHVFEFEMEQQEPVKVTVFITANPAIANRVDEYLQLLCTTFNTRPKETTII